MGFNVHTENNKQMRRKQYFTADLFAVLNFSLGLIQITLIASI